MSSSDKNNHAPVIRRRKVPSRRRRDGLIRFASDKTSQNGEDGILARLVDLLPCNHYCVDVGAWDGVHLSNTHSLLVRGNWKGVLIEADPSKFEWLKELHEPLGNACIGVAVSSLPDSPTGLVQLLKQTDTPKNFGLLCIDVDGSDYWIMRNVLESEEFEPTVVVVEFNPTMPHDLIYVPPQSDDTRHGASLAALVELAQQHDYVLVETTLYNAFFVLQEMYKAHLQEEVPDTSMEALHEVSMGTSLYQLYDGTLNLWGCKKLLWHRLPIKEEDIQVIPANQRSFPFAPPPPPRDNNNNNTTELYHLAVDMSSFCSDKNDPTMQTKCADALWNQLSQNGFCLVRGTGISREDCESALQATHAFLHTADESIRRSCLAKDRARRGYSPVSTENFASLIGSKGPNDLVKKFRIGGPCGSQDDAEKGQSDDTGDDDDTKNKKSSPLLRPNVWPDAHEWGEADVFRNSIESYYAASSKAAQAVTRAICNAVLEREPRLSRSMEALQQQGDASSILTLLGYSRHKKKKKQKSLVAPHTDVGIITLLLFDGGDCAVLQRKSGNNNTWANVVLPPQVPEDPIFVANIGDLLSELSDGLLPSTLHRVVAQPNGSMPRSCLALFVGLEPNQTLVLQDETMTYEQWRRRRIARAQQMLKASHAKK